MEAMRLMRVRKWLEQEELDALLIASPYNRRYLTGFTGSSGYVLITKEHALLLTDFRYMSQATEQAPIYEVIQHATKPLSTVSEKLQMFQVKRLGFEKNQVSFAVYQAYLEQFEGVTLVPTENIVERLRGIKDEVEISLIKRAIDITERAFNHILGVLKPGISERDISAELEYFMRMNGAASSAYPTIVASGERSALPHGLASSKRIGNHEFVTLDFGANFEGYCADLTRTVFIGSPTQKHKEIYRIVLEANLATLASLKPGMTGKEGDELGRAIIASYGYSPYFGHGLGHAFGLEIHELMRFSSQTEDLLEPGMVMTVEPGIYLPGFGGVRIEDNIRFTNTGIEVLTQSSKELIAL
ncbi:Xaa-Pro peptidase family protein [Paenibacillus sp. R14(2021)]|uniref:M24 family metallopeptidase n=1 Tax=Paenibacillus sp. R14(2021) TaxID=2859228 RepID=UPI001C61438B|nr:Xaa-Pro peptidase family protein [Paenibacillus sp. R14(2021)]